MIPGHQVVPRWVSAHPHSDGLQQALFYLGNCNCPDRQLSTPHTHEISLDTHRRATTGLSALGMLLLAVAYKNYYELMVTSKCDMSAVNETSHGIHCTLLCNRLHALECSAMQRCSDPETATMCFVSSPIRLGWVFLKAC